MSTFDQIHAAYLAGTISKREAKSALDAIGIRGEWRSVDSTFIGYDYRSQAWIDTQPGFAA